MAYYKYNHLESALKKVKLRSRLIPDYLHPSTLSHLRCCHIGQSAPLHQRGGSLVSNSKFDTTPSA